VTTAPDCGTTVSMIRLPNTYSSEVLPKYSRLILPLQAAGDATSSATPQSLHSAVPRHKHSKHCKLPACRRVHHHVTNLKPRCIMCHTVRHVIVLYRLAVLLGYSANAGLYADAGVTHLLHLTLSATTDGSAKPIDIPSHASKPVR
jgi:hypothetical protein